MMVPTTGMIIGSAVSGPSLAVERLKPSICVHLLHLFERVFAYVL